LKRLYDLIIAYTAFFVLSPLLLVIAIGIFITMGRPIFFRQTRPGLYGKPFRLIKFRTMNRSYDEQGAKLADSERLTPFGNFLRSNSFDELPELINVIKGDMSLVGPRPLLMQYLDRYSHKQARRHEVKPGITGWAQVNGRNSISWADKFELDVWYVDNCSVSLDLKIIAMTFRSVLTQEGINQKGEATVKYFQGNSNNNTPIE